MKKIKLLLICLLTSLTFVSCDMNAVMDTLNKGLDLYGKYEDIRNKHRGEPLRVTKLNDVNFNSSRGSATALLNSIEDVNYITYPGADSKFRDTVISELKTKVNSDNLKQEVCNNNECVYSFKDKVLIITKQNGDNLDAMTVKGDFSNQLIQQAINSGDIYKIKSFIKN